VPEEETRAQTPQEEQVTREEAEAGSSEDVGVGGETETVRPLPSGEESVAASALEPGIEAAASDLEEEEEEEEEESLGTVAEVEELSPTSRRIKGYVPAEKVQKIFREYWEELSQSVQIPGFRKGRVPRRLLERRVGAKLHEELKKGLKEGVIAETVKEHGLYLVGTPEFTRDELTEGEPFEFEAVCEVVPDFAIPPFEDIEVRRPEPVVTAEEIDREIERLRAERAEWVTVDEWPPKEDDALVATVRIRSGNKTFREDESVEIPAGSRELYGIHIEDLPSRLCGGDRKVTAEVRVPENHRDERLRTRRVTIEVEIHEVKRRSLPEVTDEWARLFECDAVEDLRKKIEERLKEEKRREIESELGEKALEAVLERVDFPVPETVLKRMEGEESDSGEKPKEESEEGASTEELKSEGETEGERAGDEKDRFLRTFRETVLVDRIAEAEKISLEEEELDGYLSAAYGASGGGLVELKRNLERHGLLDEIRRRLLRAKVCDVLASKCRIVEEGAGQEASGPEKEGEKEISSVAAPEPVSLREESAGAPDEEAARETDPGGAGAENGEDERKAQEDEE